MTKFNYEIDENGYITGITVIPFDENKPFITVNMTEEELMNSIELGASKIINDKLNNSEVKNARELNKIRNLRENVCFPIVNRGQMWYNKLSEEQKAELDTWYEDWLNAPETKIIPSTPDWIK